MQNVGGSLARPGSLVQSRAPITIADRLVNRCVAAGFEIAWHLYRDIAVWAHPFQNIGEECAVIRDPMEDRVRVHEVEWRLGRPVPDLGFDPRYIRMRVLRLCKHIGGIVQADDLGFRPTRLHELRYVAGAAPEVEDGLGGLHRHRGEEVDSRADAMSAKGKVLRGIPGHEAALCSSSKWRGWRSKASAINS